MIKSYKSLASMAQINRDYDYLENRKYPQKLCGGEFSKNLHLTSS